MYITPVLFLLLSISFQNYDSYPKESQNANLFFKKDILMKVINKPFEAMVYYNKAIDSDLTNAAFDIQKGYLLLDLDRYEIYLSLSNPLIWQMFI